MQICPPIDQHCNEFDQEVYEILLDAHEINKKTKITELEIEISLIIAKYCSNFSNCKDKLMNILLHITKNDIKRLRRKEKGNLYLQLSEICENAEFYRK